MNAARLEVLALQALSTQPWPDPRFPPSPYYRFFRVLCGAMKPNLSVELGVCGGGASFHMAIGWPGGKVIGIEHAAGSDHERANWDHIRGKCPNWELLRGDSVTSAPFVAARYGKVDLIFVDTIHTLERTVEEFEAWLPHLSDRAVVCFDDMHRREMAGFWEWLPGNKLRLDDLHPGGDEGGFGVWWA